MKCTVVVSLYSFPQLLQFRKNTKADFFHCFFKGFEMPAVAVSDSQSFKGQVKRRMSIAQSRVMKWTSGQPFQSHSTLLRGL